MRHGRNVDCRTAKMVLRRSQGNALRNSEKMLRLPIEDQGGEGTAA